MAAPVHNPVGDWALERQIGAGSFAVVWKARHVATGAVMAVKDISLDKLTGKLKASLASEVAILRETRHENIVQLHDVMEVCCSPSLAALEPLARPCRRRSLSLPLWVCLLSNRFGLVYSRSSGCTRSGGQQAVPGDGVLRGRRPVGLPGQAHARA